MRPIITPNDIERLARPCDANPLTAGRAIEEAMQIDVAPRIGSATFRQLGDLQEDDIVFVGGTYTSPCGEECSFEGLAKAVAYFAWGRLVKTSPVRVTRFGVVEKRGDNSTAIDFEERQVAYNDAFAIAQHYLEGVIAYIKDNPFRFPAFERCGKKNSGRGRVNIIAVNGES